VTLAPTPAAPYGRGERLPDAHEPPVPDSVRDTGLSEEFIVDLLLKTLYVQGARTGSQLVTAVRLPFAFVDDRLMTLQQRRLVEVLGTSGPNRGAYVFNLTTQGRDRAREALASSQYVGPAPVPLPQYRTWVEKQTIRNVHVTREVVRDGFKNMVLGEDVHDVLGPSINSAKSLFLYGAPGNGKTMIAETISHMLGGDIFVPFAVEVEGQIMIVYDPVYHHPVEGIDPLEIQENDEEPAWLKSPPSYDMRFVKVRRPVVLTGGELTLEQLDLQYDTYTKMYQAPFQVKANGGVLILDDFGRQRVPPKDLLNRWIVPLEKRIDFLTLHTGGKFPVPFDTLLIMARRPSSAGSTTRSRFTGPTPTSTRRSSPAAATSGRSSTTTIPCSTSTRSTTAARESTPAPATRATSSTTWWTSPASTRASRSSPTTSWTGPAGPTSWTT
jgi:predicted ATPase with chaperone activity